MSGHRPSDVCASDTAVLELWADHEHRLFGLAYRLLGSVTDSHDVLQEAFVRLRSVDPAELRTPGAWLTTVVTRLCLNQLAAARTRRERYIGPWLPEPVASVTDPAEDVVLAESISAAFLVLLEALTPAERAVFVLHEVFGHPFAEIAETLGRSEAACRKLASRARSAMEARRPRFASDPAQRDEVSQRFRDACTSGELRPLLAVLAPEVSLVNDGGGQVRAARRVVSGADRVARFLVGVLTKRTEWMPTAADVHGAPGLIWHEPTGTVVAVISATVGERGRIETISLVVNPDKLRHLQADHRSVGATV